MALNATTARLTMGATTLYKPMMLAELFFNQTPDNFNTQAVEVDLEKNGQEVAPYVDRQEASRQMARDPVTQRQIVPPFIDVSIPISYADAVSKQFNEPRVTLVGQPANKIATLEARDIQKLVAMKARAVERQVAMVLDTGKIELDDGTNINYSRSTNLTATLVNAEKWDAATGDPLATLRNYRRIIQEQSGMGEGDLVAVAGSKAYTAFAGNSKVRDLLNSDLGRVAQFQNVRVGQGVRGVSVPDFGMIYTYNGSYSASGTITPLVAANKVFIGNPMAGRIMYGAILVEDGEMASLEMASMVVDRFTEKNPVRQLCRLRSAPLVVPVNTDSYASLTVVDA